MKLSWRRRQPENYQIVTGTEDTIGNNVEELIKEGWALYGTPFTTSRGFIAQALVRGCEIIKGGDD